MGKACFNRKLESERPKGDLYHTSFSLTWKLLEYEKFKNCLDPCCGMKAIVKASLQFPDKCNFLLFTDIDDIVSHDFLNSYPIDKWDGDIFTNPPFYLWDEFVIHAKRIAAGRVCMLGRTNFFGCVGRYESGIWDRLHYVYIFNRYPDLRTPYREDGLFHVGGHCMAWFIWDPGYTGEIITRLLDVSDYAKLGAYERKCPDCRTVLLPQEYRKPRLLEYKCNCGTEIIKEVQIA